jgi:antitoxin component YwqK of YwqJK toxin-antitoxin module
MYTTHHDAIMILDKENQIEKFIYPKSSNKNFDEYIGHKIKTCNFDGSLPKNCLDDIIRYDTIDDLYASNHNICIQHKLTAKIVSDGTTKTYVDGILNGEYKTEFESGTYVHNKKEGAWTGKTDAITKFEVNYKNGILDGDAILYSDNDDRALGKYFHGKKTGTWKIINKTTEKFVDYVNGIPTYVLIKSDNIVTKSTNVSSKRCNNDDEFAIYDYVMNEYTSITYYHNGIIKEIYEHTSYGDRITYNNNQGLKQKVQYCGSNPHFIKFYPNGQVKHEEIRRGIYKDHKHYFENGQLQKYYLDCEYLKEYNANGLLIYEFNIQTGEEKSYDGIGKLIMLITKDTSKYKYVAYHENSTVIKMVGHIDRHLWSMNCVYYHGTNDKNNFIGEVTEYSIEGRIIKITTYDKCIIERKGPCAFIDYAKHGPYIEYYDNGKIKLDGKYHINSKVGQWTEYDYMGNIISQQLHVL